MLAIRLQRALFLLAVGVCCAVLLPQLAMDGTFMDGMLYATVAHNQATGFGTFWEPRFSQRGMAGLETFHEHPPLGFGLQALWFVVFGSGFWVERAYALVAAALMAVLLVRLWRALVPPQRPEHRMAWWPLMLWIVVPVVHWSYANNMLETTMGLFTVAAVLLCVQARAGAWWGGHALAGVLVFLAAMTKGLPGLYPLAAPVLMALVFRSPSWPRVIGASVLMTAVTATAFGLLLLWPAARTSLLTHVELRLLHRIAEVPTVESRFATLEMLLTNHLGPLAVVLLVLVVARGRKLRVDGGLRREAVAMGLVALAGILPLMSTLVQKSFYMVAALPVLSVALALWSAPALRSITGTWEGRMVLVRGLYMAGVALIAASVVAAVLLFGRPSRDADMLRDVDRIGAVVPRGALIGADAALWERWNLQAYLMRRHRISIDVREPARAWYLAPLGGLPPDTAAYGPLDLQLSEFALWRRERDG